MGRDPTRTVLPILIGIVLLSAAWSAVSSVVASSDQGHPLTPAVAGGGTHEILPDPRRPLIYQVGVGDSLWYLNASTGQYLDSVFVGPSATSIDRSADGNFLYVAVSGANQTVVVDIDARRVVRTINLAFSPLSVRHGRPDRLYVSGKNNASVRIVNETTGSVITSWAPLELFESLLDVSPNGSELFVHIRAWPVWMFRYSVENDNPVLLASTSQYLGQADQVIVDWAARIVYLSSFDQYGIKLISLDTLGAIRDLVTDAYPAGIALLADQHLAFALNDFSPYRSGLWAFNTSTNNLVREIPIGSELQFVVASPSTQTVLVWTPYGVRIFPLAPAVTPSDPPPGTSLTYLPPAVTAVVWGGIPEVTIDTAQVSVNGVPLFSRLQLPQNVLVGFVSPPIQVGTWNITASIAWAGGSTTTTWTITVDPPPPTAIFFTRPQRPIYAGYPILFDAHYSYAQAGSIVAYHWDFGDGSTATGAIVNKTYVNPGTYVTTLGIGTDVGQSDLDSRALVVEAFPAITLVPYAHSAGFRLPVPSTWNASENEPFGWSVVEVVLRGPDYEGIRTSVAVDMHQDPGANETPSYLTTRSGLVLNDLRRTWRNLVMVGSPTERTIAAHAGIVFDAVDASNYVTERVAIVVSHEDGRYWTIVLTIDSAFLSVYESTFETMLNGFEITLPSPLGSSGSLLLIAVAVGGAGAATVCAIGVWWVLRSRRAGRTNRPDMPGPGQKPPS